MQIKNAPLLLNQNGTNRNPNNLTINAGVGTNTLLVGVVSTVASLESNLFLKKNTQVNQSINQLKKKQQKPRTRVAT